MNNLNDTDGKPNSFASSGNSGAMIDFLPKFFGPKEPCQGERQLAPASTRLSPIASLMQEFGGTYVGNEDGLGESSLSLQVDSASAQSLALRLLADMDEAGLAPGVVVVEYINAYYDAETGCFGYGPGA